jgi:hypothetical protein
MRPPFFAILLLAVASWSCSDIATKPVAPVHVTGVIRDRAGMSLAGSDVTFQTRFDPLNPYGVYRSVRTNASGAYSIDLPPGGYWISVSPASGSGYGDVSVTRNFSGRAGTFDYQYSGFRVSGTVTVPDGTPMTQGIVDAQGNAGFNAAMVRGGAFSFILPAGTYDFRLSASSVIGIPEVTLHDIAVSADTVLSLAIGGNLIRGTVRGPSGRPLGDANVRADGIDARAVARTLVDGSYAMYLPPLDYAVSVIPGPADAYIASLGPAPRSILGPQTIDFDLSGIEWTGTVRLAGSGSPCAGASVLAAGGGFSYSTAQCFADAAGHYRFVLRPYEVYDLYARTQTPNGTGRLYGMLAVNDTTIDIIVQPDTP